MDKDNIAKFKDALTTTIATTNLNCLVISFVAVLLLLIPFKWSYVILLYLFQIVIITIGSYYALTKWNKVNEELKNLNEESQRLKEELKDYCSEIPIESALERLIADSQDNNPYVAKNQKSTIGPLKKSLEQLKRLSASHLLLANIAKEQRRSVVIVAILDEVEDIMSLAYQNVRIIIYLYETDKFESYDSEQQVITILDNNQKLVEKVEQIHLTTVAFISNINNLTEYEIRVLDSFNNAMKEQLPSQ